MKKLFILLSLVASLAIHGATAVGTITTATNTYVTTSPIVLNTITLYCTNTAPSLVYLIDGYMLKTNAAYTNYTAAITAVVTTYVTTTGITNTFTNNVYKTTTSEHAAANITPTPSITILVPASSVPITLSANVPFGQRLSLSNASAGLSYFINYKTP